MSNEAAENQAGILEIGSGRTCVRVVWRRWGSDLHVHIGGGAEHIGAAALVGVGPDGHRWEGVLRLPPHREDQLAREAAQALHAATGRTVCVTAGIHLERITPAEIRQIVQNVRTAAARLAATLRACPGADRTPG